MNKEDILHSIELLAQQMSSMQKDMNTRFEAVDKRFSMLTWFIGVIFIALSLMMTIFKFIK